MTDKHEKSPKQTSVPSTTVVATPPSGPAPATLNWNGRITSLKDVLEASKRYDPGSWWWRGQAEVNPLVAGVFRDKTRGRDWEPNLTLQFMSRAPVRHANCPTHNDKAAWLFFMQHYRLKTRLLDWTESILFATFFAVETSFGASGELWGLNTGNLNQDQLGSTYLIVPEDNRLVPMFNGAFKEQPYGGKVVAVGVREVDIRVMVQQSGFTIHDTPEPLDQFPNSSKFLIRFEIPSSAKEDLLEGLIRLGIRHRHLFPDLETLAKAIQGDLL